MKAKKIFVKTKTTVNSDEQRDSNISASNQVILEDSNDDSDKDRKSLNTKTLKVTYQEIYQYLLSILGTDKAVSEMIKWGKVMLAEGVKAIQVGRMILNKPKKKPLVHGVSDTVDKASDRSR